MFRYRDSKGLERRLPNEAALISEIRAGQVKAGTPLAEGIDGPWMAAGRHPAFRRAHTRKGVRGLIDVARRTPGSAAMLRHPRMMAGVGVAFVLLVAGGFTVGHMRERSLAEQRHAYAEAMLGFAVGRTPAPELVAAAVGAPITDDPALRTLWVRFQVARAIARSAEAAQTTFAVRGFLPPDGWMSDDYVRNARAFPDIGRHWAAYLAWDSAWADDAEDLLLRENARWATEARLTERETFELIDPAEPGLSAVGWDLDLRRQFAAEAHRLHTTLVESRGNVVFDDGAWWFADTRTQRAYSEHVASLRRIAGLLQENAGTRAAALGVEPGDSIVPANVTRMRPAGR